MTNVIQFPTLAAVAPRPTIKAALLEAAKIADANPEYPAIPFLEAMSKSRGETKVKAVLAVVKAMKESPKSSDEELRLARVADRVLWGWYGLSTITEYAREMCAINGMLADFFPDEPGGAA
jgi:hypothetical protein